jgi:two-component system response regulator HupR/HoxA
MIAEPPTPSPARPAVLIVDDEAALRNVLAEILAADFEVEMTASAREAEQLMAQRHFDVVVCDHLMPGEVGLEFLVRTLERWPQVRRIMVTGYMNPELISRSIGLAGLSACLLKPVRAGELVKVIRTALNS